MAIKLRAKGIRRNAMVLEFACERLANGVGRPSNDHHVVVGGNGQSRAAFRRRLLERIARSPGLGDHYAVAAVPGPGGGHGTLTELWAAVLESMTTKAAEAPHPAIAAWMDDGRPTKRAAADRLAVEILRIAGDRTRKTALVIDELETWSRSLSKRAEDWGLLQLLQTGTKIVLVGVSAEWTADTEPGYALHRQLSHSKLR